MKIPIDKKITQVNDGDLYGTMIKSFNIDLVSNPGTWRIARMLKTGRKWESLVGYTKECLIKYIERLFDDKMNWQNYGSYWDVDHRRPKSLFKYETAEDPEFKKCWALDNLQPLEHIANIKKSNRYA